MYKIDIDLLEIFRAFREDENELTLQELKEMIKGEYKPAPVFTIDSLVHSFIRTGQTANEAFTLMADEITKLKEIKNQIAGYYPSLEGCKVEQFFSPKHGTAILTGELPFLTGHSGADLKVGNEFINSVQDMNITPISFYDSNLRWKFFAEAAFLHLFKLFVIEYGDYRPYAFELHTYTFYPDSNIFLTRSDLNEEINTFLHYCEANNLLKYIEQNSGQEQ
jgi:hypothetical protein